MQFIYSSKLPVHTRIHKKKDTSQHPPCKLHQKYTFCAANNKQIVLVVNCSVVDLGLLVKCVQGKDHYVLQIEWKKKAAQKYIQDHQIVHESPFKRTSSLEK